MSVKVANCTTSDQCNASDHCKEFSHYFLHMNLFYLFWSTCQNVTVPVAQHAIDGSDHREEMMVAQLHAVLCIYNSKTIFLLKPGLETKKV